MVLGLRAVVTCSPAHCHCHGLLGHLNKAELLILVILANFPSCFLFLSHTSVRYRGVYKQNISAIRCPPSWIHGSARRRIQQSNLWWKTGNTNIQRLIFFISTYGYGVLSGKQMFFLVFIAPFDLCVFMCYTHTHTNKEPHVQCFPAGPDLTVPSGVI